MAMRRSLAGPSPIRGVTVIALRRFLTAKLGRETLQAVMHLPGYPTHHMLDFFDPRLTYDQSVQDTAVFTALSAVFEATAQPPVDALMFEFGQFLMEWITEEAGYQQLVGRVSDSFPGFAQCLNRLLAQQYTLLGGKPPGLPEAQVSHITPTSFVLSATVPETRGAAAFMAPSVYLGFLDKAASQVFGVRAQFSAIQAVPLPSGGVCRSCKVTFASTSPLLLSPVPPPASLLDSAHDAHAASDGPLASSDGDAVVPVGADSSPFHIVLDHGLRVLQAGTVLRRLLPQLAVRGTHLSDVMAVTLPRSLSWSTAPSEAVASALLAAGKVTLTSFSGLEFSGCVRSARWVQHPSSSSPSRPSSSSSTSSSIAEFGGAAAAVGMGMDALLFVGCPQIGSVQDLQRYQLYLSDFSGLLSPEQALMAAAKQAKAEEALRQAQRTNEQLRARLAVAALQSEGSTQSAQEVWGSWGPCRVSICSPGQTLVQLLDALLAGQEVTREEVAGARRALLRTGQDVWKPQTVSWPPASAGDWEVNAALAKLLGTITPSRSGSLDAGSAEPFDVEDLAATTAETNLSGPALSDEPSAAFETASDLAAGSKLPSCRPSPPYPPCMGHGEGQGLDVAALLVRALGSTESGSGDEAGSADGHGPAGRQGASMATQTSRSSVTSWFKSLFKA